MKKETKNSIIKFVTATILLVVLVFVIVYQNRNRSIENSVSFSAVDDSHEIEGYGGAVTACVGDKNVLVTMNTFMLMDENGSGRRNEISVSNPEISVSGEFILVYDLGGKYFSLYKGEKQIYENKFDVNIISAKTNKNGYVAVVGEDSSGETDILVYNADGEAFYSWTLGSGEFIDMDLCADNTRMVISSVSNAEDKLEGQLNVIRLDSEERVASGARVDEIYFKVAINRDYTVTALGSEQLDYYNTDMTPRWSLDYGGKTLRSADITRPDMIVLCYSAADSGLVGNSTEVEIINRLGEVTASTSFDGLIDCLSVNGTHFAVSAGKKLYIYDENCETEREFTVDFSPKGLSLFKSGKAVFALSGSGASIVK